MTYAIKRHSLADVHTLDVEKNLEITTKLLISSCM